MLSKSVQASQRQDEDIISSSEHRYQILVEPAVKDYEVCCKHQCRWIFRDGGKLKNSYTPSALKQSHKHQQCPAN